MDVAYLQNVLINEPDKIGCILEELGYTPRDRGGYYQCRNLDGDNNTAIAIYKDTLVYKNYTRNKSGNIFTLVMDVRECSFYSALKWVVRKIGLADMPSIRVVYPFGGFYRALQTDDMCGSNTIYPEEALPPPEGVSKKFFEDGVSYQVQEEMGVRYDFESDSVLIPIRDTFGRLIGCKARRNSDDDFSQRFFAYLPYQKTGVLYGFFENYKAIIEAGKCIVVESEKSVMQLMSMGCHLGLAIGGHDISKKQANYLRLLQCKIILAFDEDVYEEEVEKQAAKLGDCNVWMIKDREHKYLRFGGKESPTDNGKAQFLNLMKDCLIRYDLGRN